MNLKNDTKKSLADYSRYSSMAFQMAAIIFAGAFGGLKMDQWLKTKPVFTVALSIGSVFLAIFYVTRDLLKKK
jgi:hypothetical protein